MWVEAILTISDLEQLALDLCPLRLRIGDGGTLLIADPREARLVDEGLRMSVTIELHWPVLGVQIPVSVRSVTLDVKPQIKKRAGREDLVFTLHLDDIDISILPAFVDREIVDRVNRELEERHVDLSWGFLETLSHTFELPDAIRSARALCLRARWGSVKVTPEALVLAVAFEAKVDPRPVSAPETAPRALVAAKPPVPPSRRRRSGATVALFSGAALFMCLATYLVATLRTRA